MSARLYRYYNSQIGPILLQGDEQSLSQLGLPSERAPARPASDERESVSAFAEVCRQLDGYFDGSLTCFSLPLAPAGTTFQSAVWEALLDIAYGETCSYGEIARALGRPGASRAVGAANGANPIPIIIPCHRVIGAGGQLTGFGGGLATKRWLLDHERGELSLFPPTSLAAV